MAVTEERCAISDLVVSQCAHCRPPAPEPPLDRAKFGPWFEAGHDSDCDGTCGGEIQAGDMIRSDGEGGWLCTGCGADG